MDGTELVSAIVPFHNFQANFNHLRALLESISSKIAVIVVCDSLSVSEFELVQSTYSANANIRLIAVSNRSAAVSRNDGLKLVESKWVVFFDCDDRVYIDRYLALVSSERNQSADLIIGQLETFDNDTLQVTSFTRSKSLFDVATYPAFTRIIYSFNFINDSSFPSYPLCEDQCFLAALVAKNPLITFSDEILYSYRVNNPQQGTHNLFNFNSHFNAVHFYEHLIKNTSNITASKFLKILKFRILISMVRRFPQASSTELKRVFSHIFEMLVFSPWLVKFALPRKMRSRKDTFIPKIILIGGLGNQIFQYAYMKSKFKDSNFGINVNLGVPRTSDDNLTDLYQFDIEVGRFTSRRLLILKRVVCKYLLMLSSHGNSGFPSKMLFNMIAIVNKLFSFFNGGYGLIFLADGVGFFDDTKNLYKYYIGCFHSYIWKQRLDSSEKPFALNLLKKPNWLSELESKSKGKNVGVVHIRRGDYMGISNLGYLTFSYFEREMKYALCHGKVDEFLIFSDDPEFVRSNLSPELLSRSQIVDFEQNNAAANLAAMSLGTYYILSNSTFSWWGASLSFSDNKTVVVPKWWYADKRSPREIYPPNWIQRDTLP